MKRLNVVTKSFLAAQLAVLAVRALLGAAWTWRLTLLPTWVGLGLWAVLGAVVFAEIFGVLPDAPRWWIRVERRLGRWLARRVGR